MKYLKVFGASILGLLLFLSLACFGAAFTINQTALDPEFAVSQVDRLDIAPRAEEILSEEVPPEVEQFLGGLTPEVVNETIADLEPWLRDQIRDNIYLFYDYLEDRSQQLSLVISLEPIKTSLRDNLREAVLESPPPDLEGLPPAEIESHLDEYYQHIAQDVPSTLELDETLMGDEAVEELERAKQIVSYIHLTHNTLIGLILLLVLLIVLLYREVRGSTRQLGSIFLGCGIFIYVGFFIAKSVADSQLAQPDVPAYIQTWAPQLVDDALGPLEVYSIVLLVIGVALLVTSFVYKRRQKTEL